MYRSWWRVLIEHDPLDKGMWNLFSILALRTPWTVWKGKKTGHWKMTSPGRQVPNMLLEKGREITPERTVDYKLALTKAIAKEWTIKAFSICLYGDWTPCCYRCWSSTTLEGVEGGVRHSVFQGIWWDRSLDTLVFLGADFMILILASPHI